MLECGLSVKKKKKNRVDLEQLIYYSSQRLDTALMSSSGENPTQRPSSGAFITRSQLNKSISENYLKCRLKINFPKYDRLQCSEGLYSIKLLEQTNCNKI